VRSLAITRAFMIAIVLGSSVISAVVTFSVYVELYPSEGLDPENIFVASILINILRGPLTQIPEAITAYVRIKQSFRRMEELLECEEMAPVDTETLGDAKHGETTLLITNGTFVWDLEKTAEQLEKEKKQKDEEKEKKKQEDKKKEKDDVKNKKKEYTSDNAGSLTAEEGPDVPYVWSGPTLKNINLDIKKGELVMITGRVGSGKSSLLAAILGEINMLDGHVSRSGTIAYVPQSCWIRNASVKDNVTFSTPFDRTKFDATLKACVLDIDIQTLPAGEDTEIGERGINLSGGQKARVQLARAVYTGANIFLLDDPLSAVDTHVARRLMDECVLGVLKNVTRVLVTHQVQFLTHADRIIVVDDGQIVAQGSLEDVKEHIDVTALHHVTAEENEVNAAESNAEDQKAADSVGEKGRGKGTLVTEEDRDKGAVGMEVYFIYFKAWGHWVHILVLILLFIVTQTCTEGTEVWLAWWTMDVTRSIQQDECNATLDDVQSCEIADPPPIKELIGSPKALWNWVYVMLAIVSVILSAIRGIYFQTRGVKASRRMVRKLVHSVLGGTMAFFDVTPSGRILNRFSADTDRLDTQLASVFENYLAITASIGGALVVVCVLLPFFTIPIVPLAILYKLTEIYFTPTARELQRLEAVSRSPMVRSVFFFFHSCVLE